MASPNGQGKEGQELGAVPGGNLAGNSPGAYNQSGGLANRLPGSSGETAYMAPYLTPDMSTADESAFKVTKTEIEKGEQFNDNATKRK